MATLSASLEISTAPAPAAGETPPVQPDAPPARPKKLRFAASQSVRQTMKSLARAQDLIDNGSKATAGYGSVEQSMTASLTIPQYRRTYVQGCACATGIAGGGCCPGNAMGGAAGAGNASGMGAMLPADIALGALSVYGMYSGYSVTRNAVSAMQHLQRVNAANAPELARAELWQARVARHGALDEAQDAAAATVRMHRAEAQDLRASINEQKFNMAVPGLLQLSAATTATVAIIGHAARSCFGVIGGAAIGGAASGLFALYGGALAAKNLREYALARNLVGITDDKPISGDARVDASYREAVNSHLDATRKNKLLTGIAWAAVCGAGILGTLVATGAASFAGALPVVLAVSLAAGAWAMWQNSRTRYVPHMPISPHVERREINTSRDRAITWDHLSRQDDAIKTAVEHMTAMQRKRDVLKFHLQRLFQPQCGPKAFTVLAKSVQTRRGRFGADPADLAIDYERIQVQTARTWCDNERSLLKARYANRYQALRYRCDELKDLTSPCCVPMTNTAETALLRGAPTEEAYTLAARDLQDEAFDLERAAHRLLALDTLSATLEKLEPDAGDLRTLADTPATDLQQAWAFARIQLLQLSGALSDAVSPEFIRAHGKFFTTMPTPQALPIDNVFLREDQLTDFAQAIAPELDGAFVHAFFNPRRIEGEMDFIVERELKERNVVHAVAADTVPVCVAKTCCQ